ncbi:MAG: hypothetical protein ACP5O8_00925 [Candidatus Aenigmatarchaeota archaeon]
MPAEELYTRMKKLETEIYRKLLKFVRDLNYARISIELIFPVNDLDEYQIIARLEIENKKHVAILSYRDNTPRH